MNQPLRQIPADRKVLYYSGMAVGGVGLVLFLSFFVTFLANFGNFANFNERAISGGIRAFLGIILMAVGGNMKMVAVRGLAGSGIILDPEQARRDVEPWSRMGGGVVQDALSEVDVAKRLGERADQEPAVKVRCRSCHALNSESAKFCDQCGAAM